MTIKVGDRLPAATFFTMTPDGPAPRTVDDVFHGKTILLFAVPGAFTPTCHNNHLPGFLAQATAFKAKGIDGLAVTGVNDVFVFDAWSKATGGAGVIDFLADGNADFAKAVGLSVDGSERGMGPRSRRYAMLVADGVVKILLVEEMPGRADISGAAAMMTAINAQEL